MLWWTVQNLVITAMLACLAWVVCRWRRIGPVARHALWLVVLLKLLTPPALVWPWAMRDPIYPALRGMFHQAAEQSSQTVALAAPIEVEKPVKPVHGDKAGTGAQGWELGPE